MKDYFNRQREDPEFRKAEQALEPGYQFAAIVNELQNRLGLRFDEFCALIDVPEKDLEDVLLNFEVPPADILLKILTLSVDKGHNEAAAAALA